MTVRIMPLGDSITHGYNNDDPLAYTGYRKPLWEQMRAARWDVDFVGTQHDTAIDLTTWDLDHEGHNGHIISALNALAPAALAASQPDIILLHAGTVNCANNDAASCPAQMAALLATIYAYDPSIRILVSAISPCNPALSAAYHPGAIATWNAALPAVVTTARGAGINVSLVHVMDQLAGNATDISDSVHPTEVGYQKVAPLWLRALSPYLPTPPLPTTAEYTLRHVWSTGTDADTSAYDACSYLRPPGVVVNGIGRADNRAFGPPATASLDDTLPNYDGLYSPGGTLGSFVGRGPLTTFQARWGLDAVVVDSQDTLVDADDQLVNGYYEPTLFTGSIDTAPQNIDRATAQVQLRSLGSIARLQRSKPITALYESIRTDQAITVLLDAAGWDADLRSIDTGSQTLLYWWLNGQTDAMTALKALLAAEGVPACAYEDGEGIFHYEGREYRDNAARSVNETWHLFDGPVGLNPSVDATDIVVDDPVAVVDGPFDTLQMYVIPSQWASNPDEVVAQVTTSINVRTPTSVQKIWEYGGALTLTTGQVLDIAVTNSNPFKSAVAPKATPVTTVTITGTPTGGTITISVNGQVTGGINHNSIASVVQTALEALSNVAPGDVAVSGGPGPGTPWTLTWAESFGLSVLTVTASGAGLTGGTAPAANAVTLNTDFVVTAGSLASVALLATSGQTITMRLVAGVAGATVLGSTSNGIQVRAVSLPVTTANPVASTVDTALAAARYTPQDYSLSLWPEISWNDALDRVNAFARRYQYPREQMTVQVVNIDAPHLSMILRARISDRVRIRHTHGRINAPFYIERMGHDLSTGGGLHKLTLFCERVTGDGPARFGTARFGFDVFAEG